MLYLVDSFGAIAAQYQYDEWGKITAVLNGIGTDVSADASHIANLNPLRYRGYYYDAETGLYYLQFRYYNPEWCRFISADELLDMNEHVFAANLYLYCRNNPIMQKDEQGTKANLCNLYAKKGNGTSPQNWLANTYLNNSLQRYQNQQILQLMLKALDEHRNKQTAAKTLQGKIDKFVDIALGEAKEGVTQIKIPQRKGEVKQGTKYANWNNLGHEVPLANEEEQDGAWCAHFVSWCAYKAGLDLKLKERTFRNCAGASKEYNSKGMYNFHFNTNGSRTNYKPKKGDLIFFFPYNSNIDGAMKSKNITTRNFSRMSHVGIVVYYDKNSDILYTVEGNRTINRTEGGASAKSGVVVTKFKTYNRYTAQLIHGYVNLGGTTFGEIPNKSDYKAEHYDD